MNEQNQKLEVIRNRCKTSIKVINIIQIIAIIGFIGALAGAIALFSLRDTINQAIAQSVAAGSLTVENFKLGGGIFNMTVNYDEFFKAGDYATPSIINCIIAMVVSIASIFLLYLFKKIFKSLLEEDNPFSDNIFKGLRICFITITCILLGAVGIGPGIICGLLGWCIYSIFEYAKVLQIEVDETL